MIRESTRCWLRSSAPGPHRPGPRERGAGGGDRTPSEHSTTYAAKLHEAGTRFELHVLGPGGHGFGMRGNDARLQPWPQLAANWLVTCQFLPPKVTAATAL